MEDFWKSSTKPAPVDDEQFVQSFHINDVDVWKPFLHRYGFVVIDNILSAEEANVCETAFWDEMKLKGNGKLDRRDYQTWEDENWPSQSKFLSEKAVGQAAFSVRTHPLIYKVFCDVFDGETDLMCNVDNYGIMRGSVFAYEEKPAWRVSLQAHWDVDPWRYTKEISEGAPRQFQGLVALTECYGDWRGSTGGFRVCPGSAAALEQWCQRVKRPADLVKDSFHICPSDVWYKRLQKVPIRRGSLCIWDSGSLHANYENSSADTRIVQYVRMMPAPHICNLPSRRRLFPENVDTKGIVLSELGKKLLGLEPWEKANKK